MHKSNNVNDNNITNISSLISKQDRNGHILCIAHTHPHLVHTVPRVSIYVGDL